MKRTLTLVVFSLMLSVLPLSAKSKSNDRVFAEVAGLPGVEAVYIGPAAMKLAGGSLTQKAGLGNLSGSLKDIESLEVITCSNKTEIDKIKKFAQKVVSDMDLGLMVEWTEAKEQTRIYGNVPDDKTISSLLVETSDADEYSLVFIRGTIDLEGLMQEAEGAE